MLSVAHGVTGALIATKFPSPAVSIPLILVAHFAEDMIPHWDFGTGLKHNKSKKKAFFQELLVDFPASIILVYFLFQSQQPFSLLPWLGWFIALLPDFLEFPYIFLNLKFFPLNQVNRLHQSLHHSNSKIISGLLPQLLIILLAYFLR